MTKTPQELYAQRERRVLDAIALRKPDRIPIVLLFGAFASRYAGITREEELYDLEKSYGANLKATLDFEPDMTSAPLTFGSVLEKLDYRQLKWAGHDLPDSSGYQYVEGEYMKAGEYDAFLFDPSDFIMRLYWPRIMGNVPMSLLATGTPDRVKEYCKMLLDTMGSGGGFIMSSAAVLDDARVENVRVLADFTREHR